MEWLKILLGPAVSVIILLIGGAVMFGKFKEKSETNDKKIEKAEKDLSKRVENLEKSNGMTIKECDKRSDVYKTLMCNKIENLEKVITRSSEVAERTRGELSKQIAKNRDDVIRRYDKINLFIGETKSIMDLLKIRFLEDSS